MAPPPPDPPLAALLGVSYDPPCPPPVDVIVENDESFPLLPAVEAGIITVPPLPTAIG